MSSKRTVTVLMAQNQPERVLSTPAPDSLVSFVAFVRTIQARLPLPPVFASSRHDALRTRCMLGTAHLVHPASTLTSLSNPEASLPRTLASPWTGLSPASYRELVARSMSSDLLVCCDIRPSLWTHMVLGSYHKVPTAKVQPSVSELNKGITQRAKAREREPQALHLDQERRRDLRY